MTDNRVYNNSYRRIEVSDTKFTIIYNFVQPIDDRHYTHTI